MPNATLGMGAQDQQERRRFEDEVQRIVAASDRSGLILRLLGSLAFHAHCPRYGYLQAEMGRAYTDIDLAGYVRQAKAVSQLFADLGYREDREVFVLSEGGRAIFAQPVNGLHVDVFYEKLDFCHIIPWQDRLEQDSPTLPLAELLLEKMQIVKINEKDVIDTMMLLLEHSLGEGDREQINSRRVASLCAADWGLWRTVTMNLDKVKRLAQNYPQLSAAHIAEIASQVEALAAQIDGEPKTLSWRLRSRVGDRVKWYKDVDEVK